MNEQAMKEKVNELEKKVQDIEKQLGKVSGGKGTAAIPAQGTRR